MKSVKRFIKRILPVGLLSALLPLFHKLQAIFWCVIFGFPGRKLRVIAVTGTNGKTTTVSYIASILEAAGYSVGVNSTVYFQFGDKRVPNHENRTVTDPMKFNWLMRRMRMAKVDWVVLEITSHALDQQRTWGTPIEAAVITNLTPDHLNYHKTMENYALAKAQLLMKQPRYIALNIDDEWYDYFNQFPAVDQKMSYGAKNTADARITKARLSSGASNFTIVFDKTDALEFKTKLVGKFNVYNAAAAASITYLMHIDKAAIVAGVANLSGVQGRMQAVESDTPYSIIIDFAHTPDGLQNVLETLKNLTTNRLILVFGGTGNRDTERPLMGEIAARYADRIILTDDEPYEKDPAKLRQDVLKGIKKSGGASKTTEVDGRRNGIKRALSIAKRGDTVVITGMGDQEYMRIGDDYVPWNDLEEVTKILNAKKSKA